MSTVSDPWVQVAAGFADPPPSFRPMPFWFWNAEMTDDLIRHQLAEMAAVGIPGVYIHCRSGMRPRYLTPAWWEQVDAAVAAAASLGLRLGFVDEFNWPSGEARDFTLPGVPSQVRAAGAEHRMRRLEMDRCTPEAADGLSDDPDVLLVVGGRSAAGGPVPESLEDVTEAVRRHAWRPGPAEELFVFRLVDGTGFDGGTVDLMSPVATDAFLDSFYRPLVARYPDHLGTTIVGTFVDHEGDFGERLAWTPRLFEAYRERWGSPLEPVLPLLVLDEGVRGRELRSRYLALVTELYTSAFFDVLREFAEAHGLTMTGHVWEESLVTSAAYQGAHFAIQRSWSMPGVDSLYDWARRARHFKEAASVAHVEGKPLVVEAQGVLGAGGELTPDLIRGTAAMSAVWGAHLLVPHALNANRDRTDFPEDWFLTQPWWPHFGAYLDHAARLCWLNSVGVHRAPVLLYHPIESIWPYTKPAFDGSWNYRIDGVSTDHGAHLTWHNESDEVERTYDVLLEQLTHGGLDCDVADAEYLRRCRFEAGGVRLGEESYDVVVLPHVPAMDVGAVEHLADLVEQGARVVSCTSEAPVAAARGAERERIRAAWQRLLDRPGRFAVTPLDAAQDVVLDGVDLRFTVLRGASAVRWQHRVLPGERDLLVVVNVEREEVDALIGVPPGRAIECWDPGSGERRAADTTGTALRLRLRAWEAVVVAAAPATGPARSVPRTAHEVLATIATPWRRVLAEPEVTVPWGTDEATGAPVWLDGQRHSLRDWALIGPFDYGTDHRGWSRDFGPESDDDLAHEHQGKHGAVRWVPHRAPERVVDLSRALGLADEEWSGDRYRTCYAATYVACDQVTTAVLHVVADANARAWVNGRSVLANRDDHHGYLEMHDGFGARAQVQLEPGWNRILVKVSQGLRYGGRYGFSARLTDLEGGALLLPGASGPAPQRPRRTPSENLLVELPAGTDHVRLPGLTPAGSVRIGGWVLRPVDGELELPDALPADTTARVHTGPQQQLMAAPGCRVQPVLAGLCSLTDTALRFHSGTVRYTASVELGAEQAARVRRLDLGDVGCAARVWINGQDAGARAWPPYAVDVAGLVVPGTNQVEVEVANSGAHRRAGQDRGEKVFGLEVSGPAILDHVRTSGLVGPVRLLA